MSSAGRNPTHKRFTVRLPANAKPGDKISLRFSNAGPCSFDVPAQLPRSAKSITISIPGSTVCPGDAPLKLEKIFVNDVPVRTGQECEAPKTTHLLLVLNSCINPGDKITFYDGRGFHFEHTAVTAVTGTKAALLEFPTEQLCANYLTLAHPICKNGVPVEYSTSSLAISNLDKSVVSDFALPSRRTVGPIRKRKPSAVSFHVREWASKSKDELPDSERQTILKFVRAWRKTEDPVMVFFGKQANPSKEEIGVNVKLQGASGHKVPVGIPVAHGKRQEPPANQSSGEADPVAHGKRKEPPANQSSGEADLVAHGQSKEPPANQSSGEADLVFVKEVTLEQRNAAGFSKATVLD